MDKQQSPIAQHRGPYSISYDKSIMEKKYRKKNLYINKTESLDCTAEMNTL